LQSRKQKQWALTEDAQVIELRGQGLKWDDISERIPERSALACRLRYQNYLERRVEWEEKEKDELAMLYITFVLPPPVLVDRGWWWCLGV
jgi:hypothetical protein